MIIVNLGETNKQFNNNYVNRNKYNFFFVFIFSILNYFMNSLENFYFLILSLFQISTHNFIGIIPSYYSPTGPWSTFIPLVLCILLQIITDYLSWINQYLIDKTENNRKLKHYIKNKLKWDYIKNGKLTPGNIIYLTKDEIVPTDCLLIKEDNIKISLSPLNGESTLIPKYEISKKDLLNKQYEVKLSILDYGDNILNQFLGYLYIEDKENKNEDVEKIKITGKHFIPAGSIIKSKEAILFVVACGSSRKCGGNKKDIINKINVIDKQVGKLMITINAKLLLTKVLIVSLLSMYYNYNNSLLYLPFKFLEKIIQTWILFNGVIPFSIKIYLIIIRNLQKLINNSKKNFKITNSKVIDNIPFIQNIISDKTGTITKNELELSTIVFKNNENVYHVNESFPKKIDDMNQDKLNLIRCIGICIHFEENQFKTLEDKTIREKSIYVNCVVKESNNTVELTIFNKKEKYNTFDIDGLDFNHKKHISSKIVKEYNSENYIIFCKGSIPEVKKRLKLDDQCRLNNSDEIISNYNPILRVIACAYRIISKEEFNLNLNNKDYNWENNLNFLGLLGIYDNIQDKVVETIESLKLKKIKISILTGDRATTALAIGKEIGLYKNKQNTRILNYDNLEITYNFVKLSLNNIVIYFSGNEFNKILKEKIKYTIFTKLLLLEKCNFIAHSLIPSMKKKIAEIFSNNNKYVLAIGDGYNDIDMIRKSNLGVCVKNNNNHNVMVNSDVIIDKFKQLDDLINLGFNEYNKNYFISIYFFLKSILLSFLICFNLYYSNFNLNISLFSGLTIQLINILWSTSLITYYGTINNIGKYNLIVEKFNYKNIGKTVLFGILLAFIINLFNFNNTSNLIVFIYTLDCFINPKINDNKKYLINIFNILTIFSSYNFDVNNYLVILNMFIMYILIKIYYLFNL